MFPKLSELPPEALVDAKTVAGLLQVSRSTVWRWVKEGLLPAPIPCGPRLTRWKLGDIRAVLVQMGGGQS